MIIENTNSIWRLEKTFGPKPIHGTANREVGWGVRKTEVSRCFRSVVLVPVLQYPQHLPTHRRLLSHHFEGNSRCASTGHCQRCRNESNRPAMPGNRPQQRDSLADTHRESTEDVPAPRHPVLQSEQVTAGAVVS